MIGQRWGRIGQRRGRIEQRWAVLGKDGTELNRDGATLPLVITYRAGLSLDGSGLGRYETRLITDGTGFCIDGTVKGMEGREHAMQPDI